MIELLALGSTHLRINGAEVTAVAAHRQKLALLSYLAVEGPVARDRLLGLFWPEKPEEKARRSLSQLLYELRKELGDACLSAEGDQVALVPDEVDVDVKRLEVAAQEERWEEVVELYRGPFLDQFVLPDVRGFDDWQTRTRAWVAELARRGFEFVIASRLRSRDVTGASDIARLWAKLEPLEDEAQHAYIALLAMSGNRASALQQYEAFRECLAREWEADPLPETAAMVEEIRSGTTPHSPFMGDAPAVEWARAPAPLGAEEVPAVSDGDISIPTDIDQLVIDELAPRLEIIRKLGESSTANVYLAEERTPRRRVAVKVFSPKLASNLRARKRFEREVQSVASLVHPNIASLHWAGALSNGLPYFVMEYIEGPSMAEKLRLEGRLQNDHARRVLQQLALALDAAHRRGIVHRDVQLANILCDEASGRCLLTDFGIAAILSSSGHKPVRLTVSGELVGDPAWMSPEQVRAQEVSERSDIYSLALVGYHLLAEEGPYETTTRQELYDAHVNQKPRKLSRLREDVQPDMSELLERCLAKEPRRRPSAAAVAEELSKKPVEPEPKAWIPRLIWRRVPQWLGAYLAGGFGVVELLEMLVPDLIGRGVFNVALITYFLGAPVVFILAWYHGRAGPQRPGRLEFALLGAVVLIWLAVLFVYLWISSQPPGPEILSYLPPGRGF